MLESQTSHARPRRQPCGGHRRAPRIAPTKWWFSIAKRVERAKRGRSRDLRGGLEIRRRILSGGRWMKRRWTGRWADADTLQARARRWKQRICRGVVVGRSRRCARGATASRRCNPPGAAPAPAGHRHGSLRSVAAWPAQMGLRTILLERGRTARPNRRHVRVVEERSQPRIKSSRRGGAGPFRRKLKQDQGQAHYGRQVLTESSRPRAAEISTSATANRHSARFGWKACARHRGAWRRVASPCVDDVGVEKIRGRRTARRNWRTASRSHRPCGHALCPASAHIFMLPTRRVLEAKLFRSAPHEHPQSLIDRARFGARGHPCRRRRQSGASLRNGRSVTALQCPGGTVVAAASEPGRVVPTA